MKNFISLLLTVIICTNTSLGQGCPNSFNISGSGTMTLSFDNSTVRGNILSLNMSNNTTGDTIYNITGTNFSNSKWKGDSIIPIIYETSESVSIHVIRGTNEGDTNFCGFIGGALPIELLYFKAISAKDQITLVWSTASEYNNSHFTIERSLDDKNWTVVSTVSGAGSSNTTIDYKLVDKLPSPGRYYYRLRQDDYDGTFRYYRSIAVSNKDGVALNIISSFIQSQELCVCLQGYDQDKPIELKIISEHGEVLATKSYNDNLGLIGIDVSTLSIGVYSIIIIQGEKATSGKFIK